MPDRLAEAGFPQAFTGCPYGRPFAHHRIDSIGAHVELVGLGRQPTFIEPWKPGGQAMPAINEEALNTPVPGRCDSGRGPEALE